MRGSSESMMVRLENLNRLLDVAGDVIINASNLEHAYKSFQVLFSHKQPIDEDTLSTTRELSETALRIGSSLHHLVQAIRTVGLRDLTFRARRTVREVARKMGKRVHLEVEGESLNLDKTIVEALFDPLSHQLRNAVAHGIEPPTERLAQGKLEEGRILLRAYKTETDAFIEVSDDGRGLDMQKLAIKARELKLLNAGDELTTEDALRLICLPAVSTVHELSAVSGRGVGMDVVRERVESLGGSISVVTEPEKGTTFSYRIPLVSAVNILDALVVSAEHHLFAFPIINIVSSLSVTPDRISSTMEEGLVVKHLGQYLPLYDLSEVIDPQTECTPLNRQVNNNVLVVENKGEQFALRITDFRAPQKLVIIPFGDTLFVEGLSGTTVLGGHQLGFIVDVPALFRRVMGRKKAKESNNEVNGEGLKLQNLSEVGLKKSAQRKAPEEEKEEQAVEIEVRGEHLLEAEKTLTQLNELLLSVEQDPKEQHVNQAFRLFHSIKANLAMIQLPHTVETIHAVESVLNRVRDHEMSFSPEVMDIMMDGVTFAEEVLGQLKVGQWRDQVAANILEASARLLPPSARLKIRDVDTEELKLSHEAAYRACAHARRNTPSYLCTVQFEKGEPAFLRACLIYKRLCEVGDVLGSLPPLEEVEAGMVNDKLKFLLATEMDPKQLESVLSRVLRAHYGVGQFLITHTQ